MDKTIAMQVIFWWFLAQLGKWLFTVGMRRSAWGTKYQTEERCRSHRDACKETLDRIEDERLKELRKIRVLLIQVALRQGIEVETIEEVIK